MSFRDTNIVPSEHTSRIPNKSRPCWPWELAQTRRHRERVWGGADTLTHSRGVRWDRCFSFWWPTVPIVADACVVGEDSHPRQMECCKAEEV
eukprot:scaffold9753_cov160-Amphora_coffeaeformis.AAC.3